MEIMVTVFNDDDCYNIPDDADGFIAFFTEKLSLIPEEHRGTAKIDVRAEPCYDSAILEVNIYYYRPETQSEIEAREQKDIARKQGEKARKIAEFERLRAELGL